METFAYPVGCPLMGGEKIDMDTCFDIHMVVEGNTPRWTAPKQIYETPKEPLNNSSAAKQRIFFTAASV